LRRSWENLHGDYRPCLPIAPVRRKKKKKKKSRFPIAQSENAYWRTLLSVVFKKQRDEKGRKRKQPRGSVGIDRRGQTSAATAALFLPHSQSASTAEKGGGKEKKKKKEKS